MLSSAARPLNMQLMFSLHLIWSAPLTIVSVAESLSQFALTG